MRLNGWQRIGVVSTVVWAAVGAMGASAYLSNEAMEFGRHAMEICAKYPVPGEDCSQQYMRAFNGIYDQVFSFSATVALLPPLVVWPLAYLLLFIWSWVRRGFQQAA